MAIANITGNILTDSGVAISSLVSGSGTTNYLPKFTGTSTLGNSLIFDNGTNVSIGTTSANAKFQIAADAVYSSNWDAAQLWVTGSDTAKRLQIGYDSTNGYGIIQAIHGGVSVKPLILQLQGGNVGIGTSSPGDKLTIATGASTSAAVTFWANGGTSANELYVGQGSSNEAYVFNRANQHLVFGTNNTERMRITNQAGTANLVVGGTSSPQSAAGRTTIISNGTSTALLGLSINGGERGYLYHNDGEMYLNQSVNGQRLYVASSSGGVYLNSGATSWTANSDERLKDITGNIENAVDSLMTLRAVKHTWKADEDKVEKLALIAQDVEKVFPQVIDKGKLPSKPDEEQTDETEYLGVRYTELIPVLVKAIQELNAKVSALENKS